MDKRVLKEEAADDARADGGDEGDPYSHVLQLGFEAFGAFEHDKEDVDGNGDADQNWIKNKSPLGTILATKNQPTSEEKEERGDDTREHRREEPTGYNHPHFTP